MLEVVVASTDSDVLAPFVSQNQKVSQNPDVI